ncbi:MAG: hypothetical protein M1832_001614 [Thelocarpon impressellum]|nr:MAG: hypothetical protein M1832_001614 [Thelocarpon impressellum]
MGASRPAPPEADAQYMPHPDPSHSTAGTAAMGGSLSFLKVRFLAGTVLVPACISLAIYLLFSYLILPFARRHRHRYKQYLPLESISSHTTSLRHRASDALLSLLMPSSWARDRGRRVIDEDDSSLFDEDEGEDMIGFDIDSRRREALERRRSEMGQGERRLSRDLEEGFKDDSEDEASEGGDGEAGAERR